MSISNQKQKELKMLCGPFASYWKFQADLTHKTDSLMGSGPGGGPLVLMLATIPLYLQTSGHKQYSTIQPTDKLFNLANSFCLIKLLIPRRMLRSLCTVIKQQWVNLLSCFIGHCPRCLLAAATAATADQASLLKCIFVLIADSNFHSAIQEDLQKIIIHDGDSLCTMCHTEIYVDSSKLCPRPKTNPSSIIIIGKTSMGMNERT